jgi:hypothetical protein
LACRRQPEAVDLLGSFVLAGVAGDPSSDLGEFADGAEQRLADLF